MKIVLSLLGILCASLASAQQPAPPVKSAEQRACCVRRIPKRPSRATITITTSPSTQATADFFVGEAKVDVTKDETVVRLAMAQHGSVLIELPANDGPRYIIPGDPEMATVDERALEKNKRAIVVRPGTLFVPPAPNRKAHSPAATVTVQMRSGLVVTFLFYPVEDLAQNVHRCVLSYNRDEVVARRRAAGLPVNLDATITTPERRNETGQSAAPISISIENAEDNKTAEKLSAEKTTSTVDATGTSKPSTEPTEKPPPVPKASPSVKEETKIPEVQESTIALARDALAQASKQPNKFRNWTSPIHGLSLSVRQQSTPRDGIQITTLAVKNTTSEALRLTSASPELSLELLDLQMKPINIQTVRGAHAEGSDVAGKVPAAGAIYYAIAYPAPVLGVNQQLKILVSQTNAADEPASIVITDRKRSKELNHE